MELDPIYSMVDILVSSQVHNYVGKGYISCNSGGNSCRFPGSFRYEGWSCWVSIILESQMKP